MISWKWRAKQGLLPIIAVSASTRAPKAGFSRTFLRTTLPLADPPSRVFTQCPIRRGRVLGPTQWPRDLRSRGLPPLRFPRPDPPAVAGEGRVLAAAPVVTSVGSARGSSGPVGARPRLFRTLRGVILIGDHFGGGVAGAPTSHTGVAAVLAGAAGEAAFLLTRWRGRHL